MRLMFLGEPRTNGEPVVAEMGKVSYEFKPDKAGNLVCDVKDDAHIDQLMATKHFRNLDAKPAPAKDEGSADGGNAEAGKADGKK